MNATRLLIFRLKGTAKRATVTPSNPHAAPAACGFVGTVGVFSGQPVYADQAMWIEGVVIVLSNICLRGGGQRFRQNHKTRPYTKSERSKGNQKVIKR